MDCTCCGEPLAQVPPEGEWSCACEWEGCDENCPIVGHLYLNDWHQEVRMDSGQPLTEIRLKEFGPTLSPIHPDWTLTHEEPTVPPECPACLTHHPWSGVCDHRGLLERLRKRIEEQAAELRALRAITRPTYMSTESASVREHVPAILPDGLHTMRCICDGRGIVPGPIGGRAERCPGPESS